MLYSRMLGAIFFLSSSSVAIGEETFLYGMPYRFSSVLGLETAVNLKTNHTNSFRPYLEQDHTLNLGDSVQDGTVKLHYRLFIDTIEKDTIQGIDDDNVLGLRFFIEKPIGDVKLILGKQEVTWGENLLLPILDVVNARRLDSTKGFYDADAKLASLMAQLQWLSGEWEIQGILVPMPDKSHQPKEISGFGILDRRSYFYPKDREYGGKIAWLHEGLSAKLYNFRHHNREPVYQLTAFSSDKEVLVEEEITDTTGASVSYAGYNWLLRADLADHTNFPSTNISPKVEHSRLKQGILGLNWTTDTLQSIGIEWHHELWQELPQAYNDGAFVDAKRSMKYFSWLGFIANLNFYNNYLEPQIFYLKGLNNCDQLFRLIVPANMSDTTTITGQYTETYAKTTSPKLLLSQTRELALRIAYAF